MSEKWKDEEIASNAKCNALLKGGGETRIPFAAVQKMAERGRLNHK
jgi:hypothetical protein